MLLRLSAIALSCLSLSAFAEAPHWTYEGEHGPGHWAELDKNFAECKLGHAQSPIDIRGAKPQADAPDLEFQYQAVPLALVNNGHTVQVNESEAGTLTIAGHAYKLAQFHFHTPSEERIAGKSYDLVAHLVHKDETGRLAVVAVLFKAGHENAALKTVFDNMPVAAGPEHKVEGVRFNAADLLPAAHGYYHFAGSLTTPPCTEGVAWYVLKTPVEASRAQIGLLHKLYRHNNRPVQALNGREVIEHL